jgi:CBS domain-containing protein
MTIGEICNRQVVIAHANDTIADAARRMRDFHVGTLVVVEDQADARRPIGILTDRDVIVRVIAEDSRRLDALRVHDVMSGELVTALEGESLLDGLKRMRSHGIRRLPVVNDHGGLEGILAFDDLVELLAEELSDLAALLTREQKREAVLS